MGFADEGSRAEALAGLAPHLLAPLQERALHEALEAARAIVDKGNQAEALARLLPHVKQLPMVRLYSLWRQTLHILSLRDRSNFLSDLQVLIPLIAALGEKEALIATMQAIIKIGKWFP